MEIVISICIVVLIVMYILNDICIHDWKHEYTARDQDQMPTYYVYKCDKCKKEIQRKTKLR